MNKRKIKEIFKEIGKGCLSFFAFMLGAVVVALFDMLLDGFLLDNDICLALMQLIIVAGQLVVMVRLRCKTLTALSVCLAVIVFAIAIGGEHIGLRMALLLFAQVIPINLINERRRKDLDKYRTSDGGYMGGSAIAQLHELERNALKRAAEYYAEIKRETAKEIFEELDKYWIDSNTLPDCARLVDLDKVEEIKRRYIKHDLERDTGEAETDGKR